jgi:hypothetical protein
MQFLLAMIELCLQDLHKSLQQQGFSSLCQSFTVLASSYSFGFLFLPSLKVAKLQIW